MFADYKNRVGLIKFWLPDTWLGRLIKMNVVEVTKQIQWNVCFGNWKTDGHIQSLVLNLTDAVKMQRKKLFVYETFAYIHR